MVEPSTLDLSLRVVGIVRSPRTDVADTEGWGDVRARIELAADLGAMRPNPIGVSACSIVAVGDTWLEVRGLDAVDATPVLDLEPVVPRLLPADVHEPGWSAALMAHCYTR